jgi:DNA-binding transcriptional MerR regulator
MSDEIRREIEKLADEIGVDRKRSIGDVAKELNIEAYIIRFWETKFPQIKPEIGKGARRYYYNKHIKILKRIRKFLYEDGYTISGLQKLLKKRKQDNYKDEDLDIIMSADFEREMKNFIELDNFIDPEVNVEISEKNSGQKNQQDQTSYSFDNAQEGRIRLMQFANIKIPAIDHQIRSQINKKISNIRQNIGSLKTIIDKIFN